MTTITSTELGATGRYIDLGSPAAMDDLGSQTVIAYCRPTSTSVTGYLYAKGDSGGGGPRLTIAQTSGYPSFGADSGTDVAPNKVADTAVTLSSWQHIQATWDGSLNASGINLYINAGAALGSSTATDGGGSLVSDASLNVFLLNRTGLGREFVGDVAYVAVWDRVLSDSERTTVRTGGPLDVPSGLVLCWANDQDYSTNAFTASARSTRVTGATPSNTTLLTVLADLSGEAILSGITADGGMATAPLSSLSGEAILSGITAEGGMGLAPGVITTPVLKNNTGTILASVSGIVANIYHPTTGALVVRKTGLSSNGSGIVTISDVLLSAGTTYAYELDLSASSQGRRLPTGVAA